MSIKLMSRVWELDLSNAESYVLLALADHANDDGYCYPSIARVVWKTGYSRRNVQRIIRKLEGEGVVEIAEETYRPGTPRTYFLNLDNAPSKPAFSASGKRGDKMAPVEEKGVPSATGRGDNSDKRGDKSNATGDTAMAPEPSLEPSFESSINHQQRDGNFRLQNQNGKGQHVILSDGTECVLLADGRLEEVSA